VLDPHWVPRLPDQGQGSSAWAPVYSAPRRAPWRSGERQARQDVLEQSLARREPRLRQLADDLSRGGHQLGPARRLHGAARALSIALEPLLRDRWRRRLASWARGAAVARRRGSFARPPLGGDRAAGVSHRALADGRRRALGARRGPAVRRRAVGASGRGAGRCRRGRRRARRRSPRTRALRARAREVREHALAFARLAVFGGAHVDIIA